jgi:hypothetical protein
MLGRLLRAHARQVAMLLEGELSRIAVQKSGLMLPLGWEPSRHVRFTADYGSADGASGVYEFPTQRKSDSAQ